MTKLQEVQKRIMDLLPDLKGVGGDMTFTGGLSNPNIQLRHVLRALDKTQPGFGISANEEIHQWDGYIHIELQVCWNLLKPLSGQGDVFIEWLHSMLV